MSLIKNSTIIIIGVVISNLLAYIFHLVAGRILGPADYGVFGALMSLFLVIALPAGALSSAITKFTSQYNSDKNYSKIAHLRKDIQKKILIIGSILFTLILLFSNLITNYLKIKSNTSVIIVGFTLIFALILPINRGILQGMKKFKQYSINTIIEAGARLILLVILLIIDTGVNGAVLSYGLAYFIAFLFVFPSIKEIKINKNIEKQKSEKAEMKGIYKFIFLVLFVNLIMQMIINVPTLLIKHYSSSEFTGYWTAALNIARLSLFITSAITLVMFPEIAGEKDKKMKKIIFKRALILTLISSIGMALFFMLFGRLMILILYGTNYLPALNLLDYMGFAMIFISLLQVWMNYWLAGKN
jgi:O-antigen/teichoic acid export membrane protein